MFKFIGNINLNLLPKKNKKDNQTLLNQALKLSEWGMYDTSIPLYLEILKTNPYNDSIHFKLAEDYRFSGQADKAIVHYKQCLKINPLDPFGVIICLHHIGQEKRPKSLPHAYLQSLFDQYAPYFDENLVERLHYSAPDHAHKLINEMGITPRSILDLGCGTGLGVQYYKDTASVIHGVDLSQAMIEQSRQKNVYTNLFHQTIEEYLSVCRNKYDLILALDLFIYIGELASIFSLIKPKLTLNGVVAFTIQLTENDYILGNDYKYSHSEQYVEACLAKNQMIILQQKNIALRTQGDKDVEGMLIICGNK